MGSNTAQFMQETDNSKFSNVALTEWCIKKHKQTARPDLVQTPIEKVSRQANWLSADSGSVLRTEC